MIDFSYQATQAMVLIRVAVRRVRSGDGSVAQESTSHDGKGHRNEDTEVREGEDFPLWSRDWELHIVIACDTAPA